MYSPDPKVFGNVPDLPDGKYLGIGANKAVKVLEGVKGAGEAFVVVEGTLIIHRIPDPINLFQ